MTLVRTPLLMEFGPYGPSLSGFSAPLSIGPTNTFPYHLDPEREKDRFEAFVRRRNRLRELAMDWLRPGQFYPFFSFSGKAKGRQKSA